MNRIDVPRSDTASDRVYTALRARIIEGTLSPGLVLRESELAEMAGVGRTPTRLALRKLETESLVVKREGRGFRVGDNTGSGYEYRRPLTEVLPGFGREIAAGDTIRHWRYGLYPIIEKEIAACLIFGCFQVNQTLLAEHFGVSRTITHEILVNLERIGFVRLEDNGRWYAGPLQLGDLQEMYELRSLMEPEALEQAARTLRPTQLRETHSKNLDLLREDDWTPESLNESETALHVNLVLNCSNRRMRGILRYCQLPIIVSYGTMVRSRATAPLPTGIPETLSEHLEIVELLLNKRVEEAKTALRAHIRHGFKLITPHVADPPPLPDSKRPPYLIPVPPRENKRRRKFDI